MGMLNLPIRIKKLEGLRMKEGEERRLKKWFYKHFLDADTLDFEAEIDRSLTIQENKEILKEKFQTAYKPTKKDIKEELDRQKAQEKKFMNEQERELIKQFKESPIEDLKLKAFEIPAHLVRMVCRGLTNGVMLIGSGGVGKSYTTINIVKEEGKSWEYLDTFTTPLSLYQYLYDHNGQILILDDVYGLMTDPKAVSVLKSALWEANGHRIVSMNTTARENESYPQAFEFTGRIIIISNKINLKEENIKALVTRIPYYEFKFSDKEILSIMKSIVALPYGNTTLEQRQEAFRLIKSMVTGIEEINIRTLITTYKYIMYDKDKARELLKATTHINEDLLVVKEAIERYSDSKSQLEYWTEETGKGRRMFYYKKNQYLKKIGVKK